MIYEMLIQPELEGLALPLFAQQSAVYTEDDVAQYGSHEAYADHVLAGALDSFENAGLSPGRLIGTAKARIRVWERPAEEWDGIPKWRGETIRDWTTEAATS